MTFSQFIKVVIEHTLIFIDFFKVLIEYVMTFIVFKSHNPIRHDLYRLCNFLKVIKSYNPIHNLKGNSLTLNILEL